MAQPAYTNATVYIGETFFTIGFDAALDASHPPSVNDFALQVNGVTVSASAIAIDGIGQTVKVTLGAGYTLLAGDVIDFIYTDPTGGNDVNAIQGVDGLDTGSFSYSIIAAINRPGPSAPPTPSLAGVTDSGTVGDGITRITSPVIMGTAGANATIKLYDTDGTTLLGTTSANGSGNWGILINGLSEGSHTLRATQTDSGNNTSPQSSGLTVVIDTTAPPAPGVPSLATSSDSGTRGDGISNAAAPVFSGSNGSAEANATVSLYDGTTLVGTATANGAGGFSITSAALSQGAHTLTVKQTDVAGNVSIASTGFNYVYDSIGPTGFALSTTSATQTAATNGSNVATLTSTDITSVSYAFAVGNGTIDADNGKFAISGSSLSTTQNLSAGAYHIYLSATDAAGNASYNIFTFNVTSGPSVSSVVRAPGASSTVPGSATSLSYTIVFSTAVAGVDATDFALTASGTAGGTVQSVIGSGTTYTVSVGSLTGDGTLRLDLKNSGTGIQDISNAAITGGYTAGQTYTLDHTAPATPAAPALSAGSDTGASSTDRITSIANPTLTGSAEANAVVRLYDTDGTTVVGTSTANGAGAWSITTSSLAGGVHTLTARATDAAGNTSTASTGTSLAIDTAAPSFVSGSVNGAQLVLTYSEVLDSVNVPGAGAFNVQINGVTTIINQVAANGPAKTVTLTLASAPVAGQSITIAYTDPTNGNDLLAIQDIAGNDAVTLTPVTISNPAPASSGGSGGSGAVTGTGIIPGASQIIPVSIPNASDAKGVPAATSGVAGVYDEIRSTFDVRLGTNADGIVLTGRTTASAWDNGGDNVLYGNASANTFHLSGGNDVVDGGFGFDRLVLSGSKSDYTMSIKNGLAILTNTKTGAVVKAAGITEMSFGGAAAADASPASAIDGLYQAMLGRAATNAEYATGMAKLQSGSTVKALAQELAASTAGQQHVAAGTDAAFIDNLYASVLGRAGEDAGKTAWKAALAGGTSRAEVAQGFAASAEYQQQYAPLFSTSQADLQGLYKAFLNRAPEASGFDWYAEGSAKGMTLGQAVEQFAQSPEFAARREKTSDLQIVQEVYSAVLGRTAEASGLAYWQDQLSHGTQISDVVRLIVTGQEFQGGLDSTLQRNDWLKIA